MMKFSSVYVHIPFCLRKCNYCDFVSYPLGSEREMFEIYGELLLKELNLWQNLVELNSLRSLYFGGGTPSLMPVEDIATVVKRLPAKEITIEVNPETVNREYLLGLRLAGVNRVSIGVQSFKQCFLSAMGREHSADDTLRAIKDAKAVGFKNISVDLIYGLPDQTLEDWQDDLADAIALNVPHISLYGLTMEANTPWGREFSLGNIAPADEDLAADMYEYAINTLRASGYNQYEISNFARPGFESIHNCAYWHRENYLGLGTAAASCHKERRWCNCRSLADYREAIEAGRIPEIEIESLAIEEVLSEALFLGLRLIPGINIEEFKNQYGVDPCRYFKRQVKKLTANGLLEIADGRLRLTSRGVMLGNRVFMEFV